MFLLVFFVLLSYWYGFTPDTVIKLTGLNNMRCAVYPGYMMPWMMSHLTISVLSLIKST